MSALNNPKVFFAAERPAGHESYQPAILPNLLVALLGILITAYFFSGSNSR